MRLSDVVLYSFSSLAHRKMRSWLTILGIVIGIAAVVSLIMIGQGFSEAVNEQLSSLGSNTMFITPLSPGSTSGAVLSGSLPPSAGKLYDKDAQRIARIPEITDIARLAQGRATVEYKGVSITAMISGAEPGVFEKVSAIEIEEGRFLQESDRHVVVVGGGIAENAFGESKKVDVNSFLTINGEKFRVIGVIKKSGGGFGFAARQDSGVFVHFQDARAMFSNELRPGEIGAIVLRTQEGSDNAEVVDKIKAELDASHKVHEENRDYSVVDPASIQESVNSILSLITLFLGAIASISLLVGGLAIASSMFASVIERTHEIGVLKAIGATEQDILRIFLLEAGTVGALGGLAGALLGFTIVYIGSIFGLPAALNPYIGAFGVLFAFVIGMASGYFPAKRAARLSPVDALRYE